MELKNAIKNRRSIRSYKDKEVSKEIIEDLIDCARLAPSAKNRQNWQFVVVNKDIKDKIADIMIDKEEKINYNLEKKIYNAESSVIDTANIIKESPTLILVLKEHDENWLAVDSLSVGGAIEHICLRATDLGLGSLWIRDIIYTKNEIAELVGHKDLELISAISIGYPNEFPKQRPRKELNEMLEWY